MSKHLSPRDVTTICNHISSQKSSLTWESLEASIQTLGYTHSKWSLRQHPEIKSAYDAKKLALRTAKKAQVSSPKRTKTKDDPDTVATLKARVHALEGQLTVVLDNAAELGVPLERMQRPPHPVAYNPTPQRR